MVIFMFICHFVECLRMLLFLEKIIGACLRIPMFMENHGGMSMKDDFKGITIGKCRYKDGDF